MNIHAAALRTHQLSATPERYLPVVVASPTMKLPFFAVAHSLRLTLLRAEARKTIPMERYSGADSGRGCFRLNSLPGPFRHCFGALMPGQGYCKPRATGPRDR